MKKISIFLMMLCFACFGVANAQTLWSENFEGGTMPTGWTTDGNGSWSVATAVNSTHPSSAGEGTYCAQIKHSSTGAATKLITPEIDLSSVTSAELSFMHAQQSWSGDIDGLKVYYRTSSNGTWTQLVEYTDAYASWTTESGIVLPNLSSTYQIAFEYIDNYGYGLGIDDINIVRGASCPKPINLAVTSDSETATATWDGNATSYNISINGVVTPNVTSGHVFAVEPSTIYTVMVEANCTGETSGYCDPFVFTAPCLPQDMCSITLALTDSYADGWNGGKMEVVDANTGQVYGTYTISSGGSATYELALCSGAQVNFVYTAGSYGTENGWVIYDPAGEVITEEAGCNSGCTHTNGIQATYTMDCSGCFKPGNLTEANISFTTADLSWEGSNDSYVLQYRPWNPAGDDIITTGAMVTYTVDLSAFEGNGSVAIRHYDISDMFALIVDDIEVTNAAGTVVYSQDFENCGGNMPSEFTNMDLDGDGHVWAIGSNSNLNVNGTYGIISYSWDSNEGALTPDNWLILSGIQMGGQMTFQSRGQDPNYAAENFAIYVSTENSIVEVPVTTTTYTAEDLTPNTPYAWQVKGVCGEDETDWVSSFFKTLDDAFVFTTAGNWNDAANWTTAYGEHQVPSYENNVRIDADAIIPANVIAEANKVTINGGSITIKDGGQLKQSSATLRVTVEKEITGYGEGDGNYYFISSPFNGRTLYQESGTWSRVDNMLTGEYDLYAFDPTQELEWINYKSSPTHISFQSDNGNAGLMYGEGYLYANQEGTTLEFVGVTGKSINYTETREFNFDAESTDNWNGWTLVGNFFTCDAYITYNNAGEASEADFYVMNDNGDGYDLSNSDVALAPCTGAFVNYKATGMVEYSTEFPAKLNRTGMINMTLTQGRGNIDQARIRFGEGHGLEKMSFRNNSKLYMTQDNKDYAVVYAENEGEMPVNFKAEENGTYTLSFNTENVEFGYLHLIDNMTGNDVDLLSTSSYTFDANTTDYASRFRLVFATGSANDNFAFYNNGSFVINNEGMATVQVIDINGRIISSESINGCTNLNINVATGVYMLRLINGENVKVQKVVVR